MYSERRSKEKRTINSSSPDQKNYGNEKFEKFEKKRPDFRKSNTIPDSDEHFKQQEDQESGHRRRHRFPERPIYRPSAVQNRQVQIGTKSHRDGKKFTPQGQEDDMRKMNGNRNYRGFRRAGGRRNEYSKWHSDYHQNWHTKSDFMNGNGHSESFADRDSYDRDASWGRGSRNQNNRQPVVEDQILQPSVAEEGIDSPQFSTTEKQQGNFDVTPSFVMNNNFEEGDANMDTSPIFEQAINGSPQFDQPSVGYRVDNNVQSPQFDYSQPDQFGSFSFEGYNQNVIPSQSWEMPPVSTFASQDYQTYSADAEETDEYIQEAWDNVGEGKAFPSFASLETMPSVDTTSIKHQSLDRSKEVLDAKVIDSSTPATTAMVNFCMTSPFWISLLRCVLCYYNAMRLCVEESKLSSSNNFYMANAVNILDGQLKELIDMADSTQAIEGFAVPEQQDPRVLLIEKCCRAESWLCNIVQETEQNHDDLSAVPLSMRIAFESVPEAVLIESTWRNRFVSEDEYH